ncbi:hypothetical protein D3C80_1905220 [compost metagenome]
MQLSQLGLLSLNLILTLIKLKSRLLNGFAGVVVLKALEVGQNRLGFLFSLRVRVKRNVGLPNEGFTVC